MLENYIKVYVYYYIVIFDYIMKCLIIGCGECFMRIMWDGGNFKL